MIVSCKMKFAKQSRFFRTHRSWVDAFSGPIVLALETRDIGLVKAAFRPSFLPYADA